MAIFSPEEQGMPEQILIPVVRYVQPYGVWIVVVNVRAETL